MLKTKMILRCCKTDKQKILNIIDFDFYISSYHKGKLDAELFIIANSYFNEMGSRDYDSELESLCITIEEFESKMDSIAIKYNQKIKLSSCFGALSGLLLVIVLV